MPRGDVQEEDNQEDYEDIDDAPQIELADGANAAGRENDAAARIDIAGQRAADQELQEPPRGNSGVVEGARDQMSANAHQEPEPDAEVANGADER